MLRLFIAIDPPIELCAELQMMADDLPGALWVHPEQMHLTLKFMAEIDDAQMISSLFN
jgi:2'-5' RNA ligase